VSDVQPGANAWAIPDLRDEDLLRKAFRGADAVVHLAGHAHVMRERGDVDALYGAVNVDGTRAVAEAAAAESVRQVIFASSVKAIGEGGDAPLRDDSAERPQDAYGRSKLTAERLLYDISRREGIHATVLRFPLVYGPGVKGNVRRLFDAVWRGFPVPVAGVHNARSMLGIDNLTAFISHILHKPLSSDRPFLLGDSEAVSTETFVRMIGQGIGRKPRLVKIPLRLLRGIALIGDIAAFTGVPLLTSRHVDRLTGSLVVDSSRAWREAGISPPVPVEVGIARTAAWYLAGTRR
jgi:nucleoside-diphosphate-sugar epimerase